MAACLLHALLNVVFTTEQRLDYEIVNSRPQQIHVNANLLKMLAEGSEGPLVPKVVLLNIFVRNKLIVLLVDAVVGQMHVLILLVDLLRVRFRGESRQTLLMHVDAQGFVRRHTHIDPQVEFVAVNEQRVGDVL